MSFWASLFRASKIVAWGGMVQTALPLRNRTCWTVIRPPFL